MVQSGARIELAEHDQQLIGGRMQARGERGNRIAELNDVALPLGGGRHRRIAGECGGDRRWRTKTYRIVTPCFATAQDATDGAIDTLDDDDNIFFFF